MKLLYFIFNLINPDKEITWLSRKYHKWECDRFNKNNIRYRKNFDKELPAMYFNVPGAGEIRMSKSPHHSCGSAVGFSFGVEWGRNGYFGGVLGRSEAKRMAEFILKECSDIYETEDMEKLRIHSEIRNGIY